MFGFQRVHDLAWAAGDARARGFLLGATAGRTTLNGEGLQHQDGHSHIFAQTIPNCKSYDPCFGYELSVIMNEGIKEMYINNKDVYYYLTLMNENYIHPARPKSATTDAILQGAYIFKKVTKPNVRILASGVTLRFAIEAGIALKDLGINAEIWSVTSFNELTRGGMSADRAKTHLMETENSYVEKCFGQEMPTVAVSEYQRTYTEQIRKWVNGNYTCLGTDGFGRSDTRDKLRSFFEINKEHIVYTILISLNKIKQAEQFAKKEKMDLNTEDPWKL